MWKIIISLLIPFIYLFWNIYDINKDVSVLDSLSNIVNKKNLILIYVINDDPIKIYQCGVDLLTQIGLNYGKMVKQVYVYDKDRCYYNNINTSNLLCTLEIYLDNDNYIIQIDSQDKRTLDIKNRLLVINPVKFENCSNLFN